MDSINDPSNPLYKTSITDNRVSNFHIVNLNIDKNENDYKTFFDKENFEKHINMYPKTEVKMRVLGRVRIPD